MASVAPLLVTREKVPWPAHSRQRFLHCLVCGSEELCSAGLCRSCYDAAYHSESYFGGLKEDVLERDGHGCRVCGDPTDIVHHRKPGLNEWDWLIAICARCHAVVHRLQQLDRLIELWREQHPESAVEQLQLSWDGAA
jgi:5-methylcytosine-specific restriction endonuclease McrA